MRPTIILPMSETACCFPDPAGTIFRVTEHYRGTRLDRFLQAMLPRLSRERVQRAIRTRVATSWHIAPRPSLRVVPGGEVLVRYEQVREPPIELLPRVLYEDEAILVVEKPAGMLVHPTRGCHRNNLVRILKDQRSGERIALAHRLDRETSGLLLVARTVETSRFLADRFAAGEISKTYRALVCGAVRAERGILDQPLGISRRLDVVYRRSASGERPRPARTDFEVVGRFQGYTLLDVYPRTGRRHQIRAHLAEAGHPIVGDKLYATDDRFFLRLLRHGLDASMRERLAASRQLLHARELAFVHPMSRRWVRFESDVPADFSGFLQRLSRIDPPMAGQPADGRGVRRISDCVGSSDRYASRLRSPSMMR